MKRVPEHRKGQTKACENQLKINESFRCNLGF